MLLPVPRVCCTSQWSRTLRSVWLKHIHHHHHHHHHHHQHRHHQSNGVYHCSDAGSTLFNYRCLFQEDWTPSGAFLSDLQNVRYPKTSLKWAQRIKYPPTCGCRNRTIRVVVCDSTTGAVLSMMKNIGDACCDGDMHFNFVQVGVLSCCILYVFDIKLLSCLSCRLTCLVLQLFLYGSWSIGSAINLGETTD